MAVDRERRKPEILVITRKPPIFRQSRWLNSIARAGLNVVIAGVKNVKLTENGIHVIRGHRVTGATDRAFKVADVTIHPEFLYNRNYGPKARPNIFDRIVGQYPDTWNAWNPYFRFVSEKSNLERILNDYEKEGGQPVERPASEVITSNSFQGPDFLAKKFDKSNAVILKPSEGTHCKGIEILDSGKFSRIEERREENPKTEFVVQELITNSPLVDGHRFDLRLYSLMVWDDNQGKVKLYREGVCRFAAKKVDPDKPLAPTSILTGNSYRKNEGLPIHNSTVTEVLRDLEQQGLDVRDFWPQAENICRNLLEAITNFAISSNVILRRNFFFTGFDVILETRDNKIFPRLIEINELPQLLGWGPDVDIDLVPLLYRWGCDLRALCADWASSPNARDRSRRDDGTYSRSDFTCDKDRDIYACPGGKELKNIRHRS